MAKEWVAIEAFFSCSVPRHKGMREGHHETVKGPKGLPFSCEMNWVYFLMQRTGRIH
jgi:hypothetical protein